MTTNMRTTPHDGDADHGLPVLEAWAVAQQELLASAPGILDKPGTGAYRRFREVYAELCARPRSARRRLQREFGVSLAAMALLISLGMTPQAWAATIQVETSNPLRNAGDGSCSLIEAIDSANDDSDSAGGDCEDGSGADSIVLPAASVHTLTVAEEDLSGSTFSTDFIGLPPIVGEVTIEGNGATIERDPGAPAFRILQVGRALAASPFYASGNLTLNDLTITGGNATGFGRGGAVQAFPYFPNGSPVSTLTLTGSTIIGNTANEGGGIYGGRYAVVSIANSTISGNVATGRGGGVSGSTYGSLTVTDSTISNNSAANGSGGIKLARSNVIERTVISGNRVTGASGDGGGIGGFTYSGSVSIVNSTISDNEARDGGGVDLRNLASTDIVDSTITDNSASRQGGGIHVYDNPNYVSTLRITRSIVAGNRAPDAAELTNGDAYYYATLNSSSSIFGSDAVSYAQALSLFGGATLDPSDINATSDNGNIPLATILDTTLADNGGDTLTHALPAGSPALDAAGATCSATDQRGETRPQGGACDIGAFELVVIVPPDPDPDPPPPPIPVELESYRVERSGD